MTDQTGGPADLHALLIGIDHYLPNVLPPDGRSYGCLRGCVRDVLHVENFLKRKLRIADEYILKLTAANADAEEPTEPPDRWPTYENLVAAFHRLTDRAAPGDQVFIFYSGHGGRARTVFPELKGERGIDEALVPTNIGSDEARYLRDVELARLLDAMVQKELIISVVLDCCHSGGLTRGRAEVAIRGLGTIDPSSRLSESLVAPRSELCATWRRLTKGGTRAVLPGSGWLPEPKGYVLLAACRAHELAYEYAFDGVERNGVLTYWLLRSLQDLSPDLSYKLLHDRILPLVHSQFVWQTPMLQGEGDRAVFGSHRVRPHYAVTVMKVDEPNGRLLLNAGQAHGLGEGSLFAVHPHGTTDFTDTPHRRALAEITKLGATDSWATITETFNAQSIEQGDQAVLLGAASVRLVRKVSLVRRDDLPTTIDQEAALRAVERAVAGSGWVEAATDTALIHFQVALNEGGAYEIWDASGVPVPNLRPALKAGRTDAALRVAQRLVHLAKFHAIMQLVHDPKSPLAHKLSVELVGWQRDYEKSQKPAPQPFGEPGGVPAVTAGYWIFLRVENASSQVLNITLLDLQPDWGISQIYPSGSGVAFTTLEPGQVEVLPFLTFLPEGYETGIDVLKVFGTVEATSFRWLTLPRLDMRRSKRASRPPQNPLEELLAALSAEHPPARNAISPAYPSEGWITVQSEVHVQQLQEDSV